MRVLALGRDDRLWVGTDGGGLFLFEGGRFRAIPSPNPAVRFIVGVAEAPDGSAVIATPRAGLWRWNGTAWNQIAPENAPAPTLWTVLHQGRGGRIWAATDGLGLAQLKRTKFFTLGTPEGLTHDEVTSTTEALDGSVWLTTANGLNQVTTNGVRKLTKADGLTDDFLFSSYQGPDGTLWFGTRTAGGMRYRDGRFEAVPF